MADLLHHTARRVLRALIRCPKSLAGEYEAACQTWASRIGNLNPGS